MPNETTAVMTGAQQRAVAAHQPDQDVVKSVLPEDINWKPFAAFPPSVRLAVIVGQPSEAGPLGGKFVVVPGCSWAFPPKSIPQP